MQEVADILQLPLDIGPETQIGGELSSPELDDIAYVLDCSRQLKEKSAKFESEIRRLGLEMHSLHDQSASIHQRLRRREDAMQEILPLLAKYSVPLSVVNALEGSGDIGPDWVQAVQWLQNSEAEASEAKSSGSAASSESGIAHDAQKMRQALLLLAISRAKNFFILKLRTLRRPGADAQVVQQQIAEASPAWTLLRDHTPRLAQALRTAYHNTMRWYYNLLLSKYGRFLGRQPLLRSDAPTLLGSAAAISASSSATSSSSLASLAKLNEAFSVGARPAVLLGSAAPLSLTSQPPSANPYYPIEVLMSSMLAVLGSSFKAEQRVPLNDDYISRKTANDGNEGVNGQNDPNDHSDQNSLNSQSTQNSHDGTSLSGSGETRGIASLFTPILEQYTELAKLWLSQCQSDIFGLLLVLQLTLREREVLPEAWLDQITQQCWPAVARILDQQTQSIEQAALKASVAGSGQRGGPHMLTQLFSSFLSGILQLSSDSISSRIERPLRQLVSAYELYISKLAAGNEAVLHSNYFVVAALLGDIEGGLAQEFATHFRLLVEAYNAR